jgi:hypothetical protein
VKEVQGRDIRPKIEGEREEKSRGRGKGETEGKI